MDGYQSKQVFGFTAENSHHVAAIVFASIDIGCPVNTLDPSFGKAEIMHMLNITKPVLMFCDIKLFDMIQECLNELGNDAKIFTFGGSKSGSEPIENLFAETQTESDFVWVSIFFFLYSIKFKGKSKRDNNHIFSPVTVDGVNDTAIIALSSGTTGKSKGKQFI